ncbi:hypothetical protein A9Q99_09625 [Gammaproteobacteria bacterium 45_16_T64]|nr:hypothetical protein A9Q99_09625 [Gammaproteobacteria bacterium 45_16_T64]
MTHHNLQTNSRENANLYNHYSWSPNSLLARLLNHPLALKVCLPVLLLLIFIELFYINPSVDSQTGLSVFQLQFASNLQEAKLIINSWGDMGLLFYVKWLFADYLLATTYILVLTIALVRTQIAHTYAWKPWVFYLPVVAGTLDIVENTLHLCLVSNQLTTDESFQILHSISTIKWTLLGLIAFHLIPINKRH